MEKDIMGKGITEDIAERINTDVTETADVIKRDRNRVIGKTA